MAEVPRWGRSGSWGAPIIPPARCSTFTKGFAPLKGFQWRARCSQGQGTGSHSGMSLAWVASHVQCDKHLRPEPPRCDAEMDGDFPHIACFNFPNCSHIQQMKENIARAGGGQGLMLLLLQLSPSLFSVLTNSLYFSPSAFIPSALLLSLSHPAAPQLGITAVVLQQTH